METAEKIRKNIEEIDSCSSEIRQLQEANRVLAKKIENLKKEEAQHVAAAEYANIHVRKMLRAQNKNIVRLKKNTTKTSAL